MNMMHHQDEMNMGAGTGHLLVGVSQRSGVTPMKQEGQCGGRDEQRKSNHKEVYNVLLLANLLIVERRRRDKINTWVVHLSKLVPGCDAESVRLQESKCTVLSKACDYIVELKDANNRMQANLHESERLSNDAAHLRTRCEQLAQENEQLYAQFHHHGLMPPRIMSSTHVPPAHNRTIQHHRLQL